MKIKILKEGLRQFLVLDIKILAHSYPCHPSDSVTEIGY